MISIVRYMVTSKQNYLKETNKKIKLENHCIKDQHQSTRREKKIREQDAKTLKILCVKWKEIF